MNNLRILDCQKLKAQTAKNELLKLDNIVEELADFMIEGFKVCIKMGVDDEKEIGRLQDGLDDIMGDAIKRGAPAFDVFKMRDYISHKVFGFINSYFYMKGLNSNLAEMAENSQERKGYVYVVEKPDGTVKIGRTTNPKQRIKTLQSSGGFFKKRVYVTEQIYHYDKIELALHAYFKNSRTIGEWFEISFELAKERAKTFAELHGQSEILSKQLILFDLEKIQ